ncbi:MAG: sugar ABC transporter ATP-binding protein [Clostridiales bacterium]|jgi:ABC-type sugar transport system ATPase subunit|nr:sugar ABC transporter ATP-binding protein [Clostridiales bacterium]
MAEAIFRLNCISKTFPGVKALSRIDFDLYPGEVHCICGENGAGKSTLIKILSGAYQPDPGGSVEFEGKRMVLTPRLALELGIQTIYQEFNVFPDLSVTENIFAGLEIVGRGMVVNRAEMRKKAQDALSYLRCRFSPDALVGELSSGEKKLVEIAKAIVFQRKIVVLDEPTASFSVSEIEMLLDVVKKVAASGIAVAYISHHLDEVFRLADRITILRDGMKILTACAGEIDEQTLVRNMVGRDVSAFYSRQLFPQGKPAIEARHLCGNGVSDIGFTAYRGQILGFAGMVGSGRSELMTLLMGGAKRTSGEILIDGKPVDFRDPWDAIRRKMCYITEDRQNTGLFLKHTIARNSIIANLVNRRSPFIHPREDYAVGQHYIEELRTKATGANAVVATLSGGNQQKVVLAKWFHTDGDIFIFDEPTRGIDVGAKQEIYQIMINLLKQDKCILMVSSDMPEIVSMSDRVIIMKEGRIAGALERAEISEENILQLSIGGSSI